MYILNEKTGTLHLKNACCHAHDGMHRSHFRTEQEAKEHGGKYIKMCKICEKEKEKMLTPPIVP